MYRYNGFLRYTIVSNVWENVSKGPSEEQFRNKSVRRVSVFVCVSCVRASERKSGRERRVFINFAHRRFAGHLAAGKGVMAAEKV